MSLKNSRVLAFWWIRYADSDGRIHREKVGTKGLAKDVYRKRKTEIREGKFFPDKIKQKRTTLAAAIDDYLDRKEHQLRHFYHYRRFGRNWGNVRCAVGIE